LIQNFGDSFFRHDLLQSLMKFGRASNAAVQGGAAAPRAMLNKCGFAAI
jgi:hypothetical protein